MAKNKEDTGMSEKAGCEGNKNNSGNFSSWDLENQGPQLYFCHVCNFLCEGHEFSGSLIYLFFQRFSGYWI